PGSSSASTCRAHGACGNCTCSSRAACPIPTRCGPSGSADAASRSIRRMTRMAAGRRCRRRRRRNAPARGAADMPPETYELRLYVAGQTPKALRAFANLRRICDEHLSGRYSIEVVDLIENPALGRGDQILALPTLVRRLPAPMKKIIGDLSNTERVLVGWICARAGPVRERRKFKRGCQ